MNRQPERLPHCSFACSNLWRKLSACRAGTLPTLGRHRAKVRGARHAPASGPSPDAGRLGPLNPHCHVPCDRNRPMSDRDPGALPREECLCSALAQPLSGPLYILAFVFRLRFFLDGSDYDGELVRRELLDQPTRVLLVLPRVARHGSIWLSRTVVQAGMREAGFGEARPPLANRGGLECGSVCSTRIHQRSKLARNRGNDVIIRGNVPIWEGQNPHHKRS